MNGYSVSIDNLSKNYRVYPSNKARVAELVFGGRMSFHRDFWALKDISFDVGKGEIFGVVGSNGAGKSTLLKILAGITRQSSGSINIDGKVSALLELGAGFHPEFTGRENLYMNGSILGFSKHQLDALYEEIVDFAEIREFMDMPVKTYSSGMYVRLAFSIATTVDPDVLIVDEALAVGDEYFQKKCVDRMTKFMDRGKTIIFVSHNLGQVSRICGRAMWLDSGRIMAYGKAKDVLERFEDFLREKFNHPGKAERKASPETISSKDVFITNVAVMGADAKEKSVFSTGDDIRIKMDFTAQRPVRDLTFGVSIRRNDGVYVTGPNTYTDNVFRDLEYSGGNSVSITFKSPPLLSGRYLVSVGLFDRQGIYIYDFHDRLYPFEVRSQIKDEGMMHIEHEWFL